MQFQVTQEEIVGGIPMDPYSCPVAKTIKKAMPGTIVKVCDRRVEIRYGSRWAYYSTPVDVMRFIHNFDRKDAVGPFQFELTVPGYDFGKHDDIVKDWQNVISLNELKGRKS